MEIRPWVKHYDHDVPSTMQYPDMPVQSMFQAAVKKMPEKNKKWGQGGDKMLLK